MKKQKIYQVYLLLVTTNVTYSTQQAPLIPGKYQEVEFIEEIAVTATGAPTTYTHKIGSYYSCIGSLEKIIDYHGFYTYNNHDLTEKDYDRQRESDDYYFICNCVSGVYFFLLAAMALFTVFHHQDNEASNININWINFIITNVFFSLKFIVIWLYVFFKNKLFFLKPRDERYSTSYSVQDIKNFNTTNLYESLLKFKYTGFPCLYFLLNILQTIYCVVVVVAICIMICCLYVGNDFWPILPKIIYLNQLARDDIIPLMFLLAAGVSVLSSILFTEMTHPSRHLWDIEGRVREVIITHQEQKEEKKNKNRIKG